MKLNTHSEEQYQKAYREYMEKHKELSKEFKEKKAIRCPDCGQELRHVEGCILCPVCGWSECK